MYDVIALKMDIVAKTDGLAPKLNHFYCYLLAKKDEFLVHLYNYSRALFFFYNMTGLSVWTGKLQCALTRQ